jgi:hypothetical protein
MLAASLAALVSLVVLPDPVSGKDRFVHEPPEVEATAAYHYAALTDQDCLAELKTRGVPFESVDRTRGVDTPLRFTGPIRGVTFRRTFSTTLNDNAPQTIADCRLALAVDDLAALLHTLGVVEAQYYSMYRRRGLGFIKPGRRHPGGRAIDLVSVKLEDGTAYSVQNDFRGRPGRKTCGDGAAVPTKDTPGARFWRTVTCKMGERRSFNLILTPHYDWGHRDHLHLEVRSGIRWFLVH